MYKVSYGITMEIRQEVWLRAWCAKASDPKIDHAETPTDWADRCLEDFEKRFGEDDRCSQDK